MKKIKNAIILAGGDSTRFWPLSQKNLYVFNGKPLIQHKIEKLLPYVEKIIIVTNKTILEDVRDVAKIIVLTSYYKRAKRFTQQY